MTIVWYPQETAAPQQDQRELVYLGTVALPKTAFTCVAEKLRSKTEACHHPATKLHTNAFAGHTFKTEI